MPVQLSSSELRKSLDKAVLFKGTSAITIGSRTENLDPTYGAPEYPHLWHRYKYILIGVGIELIMFVTIIILLCDGFHVPTYFIVLAVYGKI
ncbi:hypothetical protein C1646_702308 [Rhizophagus diaphanus]|nr:hypothetical protein C1646_702308 [Rhizophagus diaphanus] [Rhizophagus sp. MUCL 43196]